MTIKISFGKTSTLHQTTASAAGGRAPKDTAGAKGKGKGKGKGVRLGTTRGW